MKFASEKIDSGELEGMRDVRVEDMGDNKKLAGDYAMWNLEILMRDMDFQLVLDKIPVLGKLSFRWMWK